MLPQPLLLLLLQRQDRPHHNSINSNLLPSSNFPIFKLSPQNSKSSVDSLPASQHFSKLCSTLVRRPPPPTKPELSSLPALPHFSSAKASDSRSTTSCALW